MVVLKCLIQTQNIERKEVKQMDVRKLRATMYLFGDTGGTLADYLGISRSTLSAKMNENNAVFTQREIMAIKERYNLGADDVDSIFFNKEVS